MAGYIQMTDEKTEKRPTILFDDDEYFIDEISVKGQHFIAQIQDCRKKMDKVKLEYEQLEVCSKGFTDLLGQELRKVDKEFVAE